MAGRRQRTTVPAAGWSSGRLLLVGMLLAAVVASSLGVVYTTHRARVLANELAGLELAAQQYEMDWHRLLLEQGVWAEQGRVMNMAQGKLGMRAPDPAELVIVQP